ncbi:MAG: hypothetical protein H0X43_02835 [Nitrosospira sp.]|nr:hypothetical protein [Nitrosospira sp.]
MEIDQLTDEQIKKLTPQQIEQIEEDPAALDKIMAEQEPKEPEKAATEDDDKPKQEEEDGAANGAGEDEDEDEPVVLNKSGKGAIPYSAHKGLRVENATLKEQLQAAEAKQQELQQLLQAKADAKGDEKATAEADVDIAKHLSVLKEDMPELHQVISAVLEGSRKQGAKLEKTLEALKREKEESEREGQLSVEEQVAEAKDNNPDLVHWESRDPEAWEEALRQDEILRTNAKWAAKPYAERFDEVVRRVRAIMPEVSAPKKPADPEKSRADARARLETAPVRRPTTLSDIQGGANPASEREQLENLSPFELTQKLMKMPSHQAAALRAELD